MAAIKRLAMSIIEVIQDARKLQAVELKKRYFQR
jgi:hypothetical protein